MGGDGEGVITNKTNQYEKEVMGKKKRDPIADLEEWQEHQYNPGYWINRIPPWIPTRRTIGFWLLSLIDVLIIKPTFLFIIWIY